MSYFRQLYSQFRGFPRTIKLFYLTDIFYAFAGAIFSTLFNLHMLEVGFNADHIGRLQALSSLVVAALAIPVGLAADRWGRRGFYIAGSLLFGIPYMVMPWLVNFSWLIGVWVLYSAATTLMSVNESPLLAGEVGSDRRASVFSFLMINFFVWNTLGVQLAGFLVRWLPHGLLSQYQWPLVISGVCALVSATGRAFLPFRPHAPVRRGVSLRPTRTTVMLGVLNMLVGGFTALTGFNNVILAQRLQFDPAHISTVLTIAGVVGWCGSLLVPWTSGKLGDMKGFALVVGLQTVLFVMMGVFGTPVLFLTGYWVRSILGTMQMSLWSAFAMGVTPAGERATASSYSLVGRNLGTAVAAKGFGLMLASGNYMASFGLAGLLALGAGAFTLAAFRRHDLFAPAQKGA